MDVFHMGISDTNKHPFFHHFSTPSSQIVVTSSYQKLHKVVCFPRGLIFPAHLECESRIALLLGLKILCTSKTVIMTVIRHVAGVVIRKNKQIRCGNDHAS